MLTAVRVIATTGWTYETLCRQPAWLVTLLDLYAVTEWRSRVESGFGMGGMGGGDMSADPNIPEGFGKRPPPPLQDAQDVAATVPRLPASTFHLASPEESAAMMHQVFGHKEEANG
jgi:hypothetical protein